MAKPKHQSSFLFKSCSLLMASLFAFSASVQLDDQDWYFWFPLYAVASAVNLLRTRFKSRGLDRVTKLVLLGGVCLFLKVVVEDHVHGMAGFLSLDMEERVVREKLGSGLVVISMFLQLQASDQIPQASKKGKRGGATATATYAVYGMAVLVALSFGLTLCFWKFVKDMRR